MPAKGPFSPTFPLQTFRAVHPFFKRQLHHAPFSLIQPIMERIMRDAFAEALATGELDCLIGRWLEIEITDIPLNWFVTMGKHYPVLVKTPMNSDASIRGTLKAFIQLANNELDPDTLFFQRRLCIEGDTELALQIKNLLYATELSGVARFASKKLNRFIHLAEPD
ncbi:MAG: hypothetical protein CMK83_08995 [Pseudomonadales bacterium]|jgi:O2-independent ubiquinone biosynthesis accessory factor UbiT|uniref:ubiquinone anaerobic biosynthesis accessory factor UbiT n=1 Tax=unclassified Ketobacter TaxID=2639109 RepID=UPI000C47F680|nr:MULTISPECIES: SCP2 sterol-binding domain-containing protein [unclassified Ketobacter]MAQ24349.1 hypothetical protein [Pseudomonadales bacterium]MEC8809836.1 SCP2 sterol-binding domain-containing protein [Pseudomonadota bacterium]TNC88295.1 MAG: hypothetical protein CSH49_12255 [Alcanivorax sp.]HAG94637.1 hypothetical protein [Gammaproteobacteria bacterium]MBI25571.1 hypothetical protein [Pseudomonadales bacterium]|tara:strand:- start:65 stop:562 length:498 start_codon:yes stop_codon:yes gene_type:complete